MTRIRNLSAALLVAMAGPVLAGEVQVMDNGSPQSPQSPQQVQPQPPVTVQHQRVTQDQIIKGDVMRALASNNRLAGFIGVETRDNSVDLSGVVTTPGMVRIALREARMIEGVKEVHNNLYSRIGGSKF